MKVERPIVLGSPLAKVPYRSSPLGQHRELLFVFLQYIFRLLVCLAVMIWDISPGNKCCCIHCWAGLQSLSDVQWQWFSWLKKSSKLILLIILSGPKIVQETWIPVRSFDVPPELSLEDSNFISDFRVSALQACWVLSPNLWTFDVDIRR